MTDAERELIRNVVKRIEAGEKVGKSEIDSAVSFIAQQKRENDTTIEFLENYANEIEAQSQAVKDQLRNQTEIQGDTTIEQRADKLSEAVKLLESYETSISKFREILKPLQESAEEVSQWLPTLKKGASSLSYLDNTLRSPRLRAILDEAKHNTKVENAG